MARSLPLPILILLLVCLLPGGCENGTSPNSAFTVRDSAGITIVESSEPQLGPGAWTVTPEPVLEIGQLEGNEQYLFAGIPIEERTQMGGTFRLDDGRIVVCDGIARTVRIFDQEGRFVLQFGRSGHGPGEFRSFIMACDRLDTGIAVLERLAASLFDAQGRFLRKIRSAVPRGLMIRGVYADGSLLVRRVSNVAQMRRAPGLVAPTADLLMQGPDGQPNDWTLPVHLETVLAFREGREPATTHQEFGPIGVITTTANGFVYGWSASYELRLFDRSGHLTRVTRSALDPVPVAEEDRADDLSGAPQELVSIVKKYAMEHYAPFNRILVDGLQHLWVHRIHPDTSWDVFSPDGRWVTTVTLPEDVVIHDIGEDYVLGVWHDEWDVQYVRMYGLERGSLP